MSTTLTPEDIAIYIATHKESMFPKGQVFKPIQVGAANAPKRFSSMLRDDEGDSISTLNPMYCELTALYWIWKHESLGPNAKEYYGLCHYRRYFDCSSVEHTENDYGEIMCPYLDEESINEYGLNDDSVVNMTQGYDVVTTPLNDVRRIGGYTNLKEHYAQAGELHLEDLRRMYDILCEAHPDYQEDAQAVLESREASFCNMAIMRREIFNEYCSWLFPLLETFTAATDMSKYSVEALRTPGHLAERLLNVFLRHYERTHESLRIRRVQCVHIEHTEEPAVLEALTAEKPVVPVAFAASDSYAPMLTTTLASLLEHTSQDRHYDLVVLHRDITKQTQHIMQEFVSKYPQATLRFANVAQKLDQYALRTHNAHISTETFMRFAIQEVLSCYEKVVYADADLIFEEDIAKLYDTDLHDNVLAAVKDIDFMGNLNMGPKRLRYAQDVLHLKQPYDYFQAGVLVLNLEQMRVLHSVKEWLTISTLLPYIYDDQDVLNSACQGRVLFLDERWNVMHDCGQRVSNIFSKAPHEAFLAYREARNHPYVIHYAGFDKPWKNPWCDFGTTYWEYAKLTPYALQIAAMASGAKAPDQSASQRVLSEHSPLRKVVDITAPSGTKRRELAKTLVRKIRKLS